jgi:voltage-gated potassium channel
VWKQEESGRVRTPLEPVVLVATLLLIPVLIVEADASGGWLTAAYAVNWVIWSVFAFELAAVLYIADRKRAALRAHWLDVAIVVLTVPIFGKVLSSFRLFRLFRLLRAVVVIARAIQAEKRINSGAAFRVMALITLFLVVIAGGAQAVVDADEFPTFWDGVWWAVVTVTTVGYGDLYPKDVEGRLIGIVVMMLGVGFLAVLTATIASYFVKSDTSSDEVLTTLHRIEAEMADLKARLPGA